MQPHYHTRCSTMTLFAVLTILDGTALGKCTACHQHQEFIRFLTTVETAVPVEGGMRHFG